MSPLTPLKHVLPEEIKTLYWNNGYSSRLIASFYSVSHRGVLKYMKKHDIPRRPPGGILQNTKYPFSNDRLEKAYLLGLRATDLYVTRHWKQVQVSLTGLGGTLDAFRQAFDKYSPVKVWGDNKYPEGTSRYIYTYLDRSFQFLINKPQTVPKWTGEDDEFYAFFSGCIDGDGTVKADPRFRAYYVGVCNSKINFLRSLERWLRKLGYHPGLFYKKQTTKRMLIYRYDDLRLLIPHLLRYMKHTERIKKIRTIQAILASKFKGADRTVFSERAREL